METSFQALKISNPMFVEVKDPGEKASLSFASLKSTESVVESGGPTGWGKFIDISEKKYHFGLGYNPSAKKGATVPAKDREESIQEVFLSTCFVFSNYFTDAFSQSPMLFGKLYCSR